jgi:hydrogenase small subunit
MGQTDLAKVVEAFGGPTSPPMPGTTGTGGKPKVIWVHGAECTGCSTSLLGLFEDATGVAIPAAESPTAANITTVSALGIAGGLGLGALDVTTAVNGLTTNHFRTLNSAGLNVDTSPYAVNIADVLIDFIDLQYHETVMGMGGDSAYTYLDAAMHANDGVPFVLVVEGAVQSFDGGGYWGKPGTVGTSAPWCSIAKDGAAGADVDLSFDDVVEHLAVRADCKAIVAIGQCATFGGYPACIGPDLSVTALGRTKSQTEAKGVFDFLVARGLVSGHSAAGTASNKVINVPGCPANPWWFTLTVVAWLVDAATGPAAATPGAGVLGILNADWSIKTSSVDTSRRLTAVYGHLLHGMYCPRYPDYAARKFVSKPGEYVAGSVGGGCLKNIGCKGLSTMSLCGRHGWNAQQPQNNGLNSAVEALAYTSTDGVTKVGGFCMTAGAPCMGCTEKGYPDAFAPFVVR